MAVRVGRVAAAGVLATAMVCSFVGQAAAQTPASKTAPAPQYPPPQSGPTLAEAMKALTAAEAAAATMKR